MYRTQPCPQKLTGCKKRLHPGIALGYGKEELRRPACVVNLTTPLLSGKDKFMYSGKAKKGKEEKGNFASPRTRPHPKSGRTWKRSTSACYEGTPNAIAAGHDEVPAPKPDCAALAGYSFVEIECPRVPSYTAVI
jgi:hypothetical protein